MFHIVAAIDTSKIRKLDPCSISHLIIAGMVPALAATSDNPSSESVTGQSHVVVCLCNIGKDIGWPM